MNNIGLVVSFIFNIIICFGIPIGGLIYLRRKEKNLIRPFIVGALVFFISQVLLRLPLVQVLLPKMDWFAMMSSLNPVMYIFFMGITAGIFEEVGRFIGFRVALKENRSWISGLAFGLGHGGIEAILIVGISSISNLVALINTPELFSTVQCTEIFLGGIERVIAIIIHIACTLIVLYGINKRNNLYLLLAILIHGAIDSTVGLLSMYRLSIYAIEGVLVVISLIFLVYIFRSKKDFQSLEGVKFNEKIY